MWKRWRTATTWGVILVAVAVHGFAVAADAPATPTPMPAVTETSTVLLADGPDPEATPAVPLAPRADLSAASTITPTVSPGVNPVTTTVTPTLSAAPDETPMVPLTPTLGAGPPPPLTVTPVPTWTLTPPPDAGYVAVLVSETVVPVGGRAESVVFVSLLGTGAGIQVFELHLGFDPAIIQVAGESGSRQGEAARVDNEAGEIVLSFSPSASRAGSETSWHKVATVTWIARREGRSVVTIREGTHFVTEDGQAHVPDATYHGVVFARVPGAILGRVHLQGRTDAAGVSVSSALSRARLDTGRTGPDGRFEIVTSHGEGFYTVVVSRPGYLTAESERPVQVRVDRVVDLGEVTLLGGDVNGDNLVDIRDLSYVAWRFGGVDAQADINGDGQVDILDLTMIAGNFGRVGPTAWALPGE